MGDYRVLYVGDPRVLPVPGREFAPGIAYAVVDAGALDFTDRFVVPETEGDEAVIRALQLIADGSTLRAGRLLAPHGIRFVVFPETDGVASTDTDPIELPKGLVAAFQNQLDIGSVPGPAGARGVPERVVDAGRRPAHRRHRRGVAARRRCRARPIRPHGPGPGAPGHRRPARRVAERRAGPERRRARRDPVRPAAAPRGRRDAARPAARVRPHHGVRRPGGRARRGGLRARLVSLALDGRAVRAVARRARGRRRRTGGVRPAPGARGPRRDDHRPRRRAGGVGRRGGRGARPAHVGRGVVDRRRSDDDATSSASHDARRRARRDRPPARPRSTPASRRHHDRHHHRDPGGRPGRDDDDDEVDLAALVRRVDDESPTEPARDRPPHPAPRDRARGAGRARLRRP